MSNQENLNNDLKPLEQWYCDHCGEIINTPDEGWLEWYNDYTNNKGKGYRIVHHDKRCMYNAKQMFAQNKSISDMHLREYIGPDGLVNLLSDIDYGVVENNSDLVEIIRRTHIPYYEEARKYHHIAEQEGFFSGENEVTRYLQSTSKDILNHFKEDYFD